LALRLIKGGEYSLTLPPPDISSCLTLNTQSGAALYADEVLNKLKRSPATPIGGKNHKNEAVKMIVFGIQMIEF
jgi:hypothetical protein